MGQWVDQSVDISLVALPVERNPRLVQGGGYDVVGAPYIVVEWPKILVWISPRVVSTGFAVRGSSWEYLE